jgi:hypothetical protein
VDTPPNVEAWKNVEITGYGRVVETISPSKSADDKESSADDYRFSWRGRSGEHSIDNPCEGTSYIAMLDTNGTVGWEKEIWHTGGYTDTRGLAKVLTEPILNRWIGFKAIIYNINNNTAVKMESYIDNKNTNYWVQVTNLSDTGDWYAKSPDNEFNSAGCGRPKNYIINNGGPIVTFRSDNIVWDFKDLSVREIQAPRPTNS